jgi:hypothetical protein
MSGAARGPAPPGVRLSVRADVQIAVDGASATLTGDGQRLVFATDEPGIILDSLIGAALPVGIDSLDGPGAVGRLAEALRAASVNLDFRGPRGTIASLGAGVDSTLGRVLTGSRSLSPGAPAAVTPLVWQLVRRQPAARAAGIALATLVTWRMLARMQRRRRS